VLGLLILASGTIITYVIDYMTTYAEDTGNALAPAWYLLFTTAVGLAAMVMMRETAPNRS
jgi:hypothetical protein